MELKRVGVNKRMPALGVSVELSDHLIHEANRVSIIAIEA